jgi:hypothetical protein
LLWQVARHALASQVEGAQSSGAPLMHVPAPSHTPAGTKLRVPEQAAGLQIVPAAYFSQPPRPLQ